MHYKILFSVLVLILLFGGCQKKSQKSQQRGKTAPNAMVVSAHPLASQVGVETLQKGGNAIDAAVATGFALAVCYPNAGNLGGGGFMVIRLADGTTAALDFREKAPRAAHRNIYLDAHGKVIHGLSLYSHLASGVPGSVAGLLEAHQKYGKLPLQQVIQPAIEIAKNGFQITQMQAAELNRLEEYFRAANEQNPVFVRDTLWETGDRLVQTDLAQTLQRIVHNGKAGFYQGKTANLIVAEIKRGGGIITQQDLKNYRAVWRKPVTGFYKNHKIISMPPPSSGGIALLQLLKISQMYDLDDWNSPETVHLMVEAQRRVYADRAAHLGDADFYSVPQKGLLQNEYLKRRMHNFNRSHATPSDQISHGKPLPHESEETTHYSIVDKQRNAVAVTTTLNRSYGSRVVVAGAGFLLNNEMDDFSLKPGVPNSYGLLGGEANAIEPEKRMLSSMTPTIVERNDSLLMVLGSPGGSTIITSVFQTIVNVLDFGMTMQQAVSAKRFHHQWLPDVIFAEKGALDSLCTKKLKNKGHSIRLRAAIGRVDAILVLPDQTLEGGADPRGDDTAKGY